MTKEEFQLNIEIRKEMEFVYDDRRYTITYGETETGRKYIQVGLLYDEGERYSSYSDMIVGCKIKNAYLRELIERLDIS